MSHQFHSLSCRFPEFKTECSLSAPCRYCDHVLSLLAQHGAVFPVMLSVGRCGVARLQMKVGHMDGMHCFKDSTSILVKIKSVSYNCRTVYHIIQEMRPASADHCLNTSALDKEWNSLGVNTSIRTQVCNYIQHINYRQ